MSADNLAMLHKHRRQFKEEILGNHIFVLCSYGISNKDEEHDISPNYWIPELYKRPSKQHCIAKCYATFLSKLLISILSAVKTKLQSWCDTSYSRVLCIKCSFWKILKLSWNRFCQCTFKHFSTLYTTIPYSKLKDKRKRISSTDSIKTPG